MKVFYWLDRQPPWLLTGVGFLLVLVMGYIDYHTGPEFAFAIFYLFPIILVSYHVGKLAGVFMSVASAITWYGAESLEGMAYSHRALLYWNALMMVGFFLIITFLLANLKTIQRRLLELANTDSLTGLCNSRTFREKTLEEMDRASRYRHSFTMVYLDLDNFKGVNDTLGHHAGDDLLCTVAHTLQQNSRVTDVAARLGGDEFAILLPETTPESADLYLHKIRRQLLDAMQAQSWPVTFSIGAITCTRVPGSVAEVLQLADRLMYAVKQEGKNSIRHEVFRDGCAS